MAGQIHFKYYDGGLKRRFALADDEAGNLFQILKRKIADFGFSDDLDNLYWVDSDDDRVILDNADALEEALANSEGKLVCLESKLRDEAPAMGIRKRGARGRAGKRGHARSRSSSTSSTTSTSTTSSSTSTSSSSSTITVSSSSTTSGAVKQKGMKKKNKKLEKIRAKKLKKSMKKKNKIAPQSHKIMKRRESGARQRGIRRHHSWPPAERIPVGQPERGAVHAPPHAPPPPPLPPRHPPHFPHRAHRPPLPPLPPLPSLPPHPGFPPWEYTDFYSTSVAGPSCSRPGPSFHHRPPFPCCSFSPRGGEDRNKKLAALERKVNKLLDKMTKKQ